LRLRRRFFGLAAASPSAGGSFVPFCSAAAVAA
jgi:hypothetical protein